MVKISRILSLLHKMHVDKIISDIVKGADKNHVYINDKL